ncbi:hypothetical protein SHKM778_56190 [Streptomyces sp. KM77-8]|uniref:Uncharacterized protein n=1 Tax=Streptomyces haneummycinicus TaxID=3074435 RepID=A0AAT9HP33_9ACTN
MALRAAAPPKLLVTPRTRITAVPRPARARPGRIRGRPGTGFTVGLEVHLEGVEAHAEHGEVAERADGIDQALGAEVLQGGGERSVGDEVVLQHLAAEPVERPVGRVVEDGLTSLGDGLDSGLGDAGRHGLVHMGVPRVLGVPVAGRHQQRQLP